MIHAFIIHYRDSTGAVKAANAHTRKGAETMARERLKDGAQWATVEPNR